MTTEEELAYCLRRLLERIDFNGGFGPYEGGPAFVVRDARKVLEKYDAMIAQRNKQKDNL